MTSFHGWTIRMAALVVVGTLMLGQGMAQTRPSVPVQPGDPIVGRRSEVTYRLKPEDIIRVQVFGQNSITQDIPVGRDGNIAAPFVGTLRAEGKTTSELEADLYDLYVKRLKLRNPVVSVTITRFRELRASVGGFVQRPGQFAIRPGDSLVTLLNLGGGPVPDRADLRRATLRKANTNELIPIDLFALLIRGDISQNYEIEDGDELSIPEETRNRILVLGAVQRPGTYPYKEPMTVADAISLAGGEIPYRSRFSQTQILRQKNGDPNQFLRIKSDFVAYVRKGDSSQNVILQPGDFVYIPQTNTPDFAQIQNITNSIFLFNTFGNLFGLRLFR
ncbi:MAG: hypothetical protein C4320_02350 [Armatimonadota bacterium]